MLQIHYKDYMETTVGHGKDKRLEKENEGEQDHIYKN